MKFFWVLMFVFWLCCFRLTVHMNAFYLSINGTLHRRLGKEVSELQATISQPMWLCSLGTNRDFSIGNYIEADKLANNKVLEQPRRWSWSNVMNLHIWPENDSFFLWASHKRFLVVYFEYHFAVILAWSVINCNTRVRIRPIFKSYVDRICWFSTHLLGLFSRLSRFPVA